METGNKGNNAKAVVTAAFFRRANIGIALPGFYTN